MTTTDTETLYRGISEDLFTRYPDARTGPAHVCLDDENWQAYDEAIKLCLYALVCRCVIELDNNERNELWLSDVAYLPGVSREIDDLVVRLDYYVGHSLEELAATLTALRLVEWHETGCVGDAPPGK